jgi:hypothetical protein
MNDKITSRSFGAIDEFQIAPLLSLLPVAGNVSKLAKYTSSLYVRYEKIDQICRELQSNNGRNEGGQRFFEELEMLREVLNWLEVSPEGGVRS